MHISELLRSGELQRGTAIRFIRVIKQIQKQGLLFPRISADEDGEAIALWKAGRMSLEVSVPPEGNAYVRMTDAEGREQFMNFVSWLPIKELTRFLAQLTRRVEQVNPAWRTVFKS
ncbi:hypothetical protein UB45_05840 [Terrabacter sp. 28]|nr:hypothetical protein UB45_05840 [Terrabacter sp. 28]